MAVTLLWAPGRGAAGGVTRIEVSATVPIPWIGSTFSFRLKTGNWPPQS